MSPNDDRPTRLLAETFHGDWSTGPAGDFARQAARRARRYRSQRQAALLAGALTALATVLMVSRHSPAPSPLVLHPAPAAPAYEVISDDDLLAALHDRPVLVLPQGNGAKKIVVLADATNR